ncbi:hypothetical protein PVK06_033905 [Gossypium arboreum]|uniref:Uncharacterized protein n=1 Tax=Gossypium arboreum TaxID=29729 RepID=A0ABR0NFL9_GOSAR|nr:hypothetical protein PVK06_033905 [Gossypium arboreum]
MQRLARLAIMGDQGFLWAKIKELKLEVKEVFSLNRGTKDVALTEKMRISGTEESLIKLLENEKIDLRTVKVVLVSRVRVQSQPNAFDGDLLLRWGSLSPRELARFKELLEKPVRLKPGWLDSEDMTT